MNNAIEVSNLTVRFKDFKAVHNLSFTIKKGKIYGFLGKNGAGKTTTIRAIMGLISLESGSIRVLGKDVSNNRVWTAKQIGYMVETPGFYENLSAYDNLDITCKMYNIPNKHIEEILKTVKLNHVGMKKVKHFSLGMKQRLGIANALIHSPKVLILDEPTNGLDPEGIREMRLFLRDLASKKGITILISSHILSEIQEIADIVGVINDGQMVGTMNLHYLKIKKQRYLKLEVDDLEHTSSILKDMNMDFCVMNNQVNVYCKQTMNWLINKHLVDNKIKVHNLSIINQSLEEEFFSLIHGQAISDLSIDHRKENTYA